MSTTIDSLDIQITTSAGNSAIMINKLANALGRLKQNSKLTSVANNLTKLSLALEKVNSTPTHGINKLSKSLGSLSTFNASGFRNTVNALNKIPKILDSLDTSTLDKFKRKMKEVADSLAPLASRIDTISNGFSRLPSKIKGAANATSNMSNSTNSMGSSIDSTNLNLFTMISNLQSVIQAVNTVADSMANVVSQAIEWDGIQFRFGQSFGEDAQEVYDWIVEINKALNINIQEFMQYSGLYASLLNGFGLAQEKVTAIAVGLTELSYDIWAFSNDRFKSLEDASEAIRSAITGEIEPIRNAGIALTEASLQEYIDSTHLAGVSIEKLTEAQKAEVRYAAMVESAMNQGIIGTYAREMNTAEGAVRTLSQTTKTLVQAFGSLFIPILQKVIPYITAFVEILTDAIHSVASFFGITIGKLDWSNVKKGVSGLGDGAQDAATGLGSAAKAAKKLRDYTMGFDELNVINPDTGSGAGGSGGAGGASGWGSGLDLESLWDEALLANASKKVDELKAKILGFIDEWKWALIGVGVVATGIATLSAWASIVGWGAKIAASFGTTITVVKTVIGVFNTATSAIRAVFGALAGSEAATSALVHMFPKLSGVVVAAKGAIVTAAKAVGGFLSGLAWWVWVIIAAVGSLVYYVVKNWETVKSVVVGFYDDVIAPKIEEIKKDLSEAVQALKDAGQAIWDALPPKAQKLIKDAAMWIKDVVDAVAEWFATVEWLKIIGKVIETLGGIVFATIGGVIANAINILVGLITNTVKLFTGTVQIISGVIELIVAIFTGGDVGAAWEKIWKGVWKFIEGYVGIIIGPVISIVEGTISWFGNLVPGMKEKLDAAWANVKKFFSVTEWKKKVTDVIDTIKKNFKMPEFPKIKLSVTWDKSVTGVKKIVTEALGLDGWPNLKWSTYATGGLPSMGEMFIARENGPELVGNIGNRSAVANNDQIVEAVAQGVYGAVRAAMGGDNGGSGQNINIYLDGKQIYASVKRTENQRGANLMGNQLGYLY